jgi:pathogenesis-related protein 1
MGEPHTMRLATLVAIFLVNAICAGADPATGSAFTTADAESFVGYHNKLRKGVGVEPLEWSPEIAAYAQKWADRLAAKGDLEHRPINGEWARIYGENLAIDRSILACAESWHSEVKDYPSVEPIPSDFSTFTAGHYTQMVWRKTKRIGAGVAVVNAGRFKGMTLVVCNYDPPGNMVGDKPY